VDAPQRARELVMAYGRNATACQILNPGISYWFNTRLDAVAGYVRRGAWMVVAGEPICHSETLLAVVKEFEAWASGNNLRVCYVCAAGEMRDVLSASASHSAITIGAQPVWNPSDWPAILKSRSSLRAQLSRSLNKGVRIESLPPAEGALHPEIRQTLREWLERRLLPPMHFLVEPEVLSGIVDDRLLFVARRDGRIVAFLVASPIAARNGYLVEELARSSRAPNGTSELLIDAAMNRFAQAGCTFATMGLVALASGTLRQNPFWLRSLMALARAHANRFYNFRGLERFRAKMHPVSWEPIYAISNERHFSPQALYAVGGAFSTISPLHAIGLAVLKGAREELRRVLRK
jgi:phosphatidylglycerol lysyltransferase